MKLQIHFVEEFVLIYNSKCPNRLIEALKIEKLKQIINAHPQFKMLTLVTVISDVKGCRQANRNKKISQQDVLQAQRLTDPNLIPN